MKRLASILLFIWMLLVVKSCKWENDVYQDVPSPSSIYADDDSTLLGTFSHNGYDIAPYFCESLREEVKSILNEKDKNGQYFHLKKDKSKYSIYEDELKVYTTLDPQLQKYAEAAVYRHLSEDLQPAFTKNNEATKSFPFSNTYNGKKVSEQTIHNILKRARKSSIRYSQMRSQGHSDEEIETSFNVSVNMRVFSWSGDIDTIMTPNDSIRYYKNIIRSGLISIEPSTGHVKAWVGGINYDHFKFDHVRQGKRQIGSAIKPFIYSAGFSMGVAEPCTILSEDSYCVDPCDPSGRRWCPSGTSVRRVKDGFTHSSGSVSVPMMSLMGACSGPTTVATLFKRMNIDIPEDQVIPSMCLGTPDMSLFQATAAYATFINNGKYVIPKTVRRIEDKDGNVIYSSGVISNPVINPMISYDILQMMELVVKGGTSTSLRWHKKWGGITHPTAGKTGTTQGNSDMWFFGATPDLVTGVWTGGEDKQVRFRSMTWGQGARASLPIYGYYMQQVYADSSLNISTKGFEAPRHYDPSRFNCDSTENNSRNPFK
ncbi:MAG: penicillin-binding transpeptidase domain-containing protein [Crocinitomicaceae bacterium]